MIYTLQQLLIFQSKFFEIDVVFVFISCLLTKVKKGPCGILAPCLFYKASSGNNLF